MSFDAQFYIDKAQEDFRLGKIEEGVQTLDQAISLDPNNIEYLWIRGKLRYEIGPYQLAVDDLTKIIQLSSDPDDLEEAYQKRAIVFEILGDYRQLMSDIGWLINHGYDSSSLRQWRGYHELKLNFIQDAITDFSQAIRLDPEHRESWLLRAQAFYQDQNFSSPIDDLTKIISMSENNPRFLETVYHWRGKAYYKLGDSSEALKDFNTVMKLQGNEELKSADGYIKQMLDT